MIVVPAGSFTMGSPKDEAGREQNEGPQHLVRLARQFAVGRFAVTFDEWDACVADGGCNGYRPSGRSWSSSREPVINVSWDDAQTYVAWLAKKTGKPYRLLTESEREYVTRAGTTTRFWFGNSISTNQANFVGQGKGASGIVPVDSFAANPWGLDQVHGNVWEWTEDCTHGDYQGAPADGTAWTSGANCDAHVARGGCYTNQSDKLRSASRNPQRIGHSYVIGFRVARSLLPSR
jgi:formylglycine-generating enzyme required for sulfatase activity